ncbi:MAG TPA: hypothetical protein VF193_12710 [Steroidobacter sp.]
MNSLAFTRALGCAGRVAGPGLRVRDRTCVLLASMGVAALVALAGCGPVRLVANTNIPPPLIVKLPITVALFLPTEFSQYVHDEERQGKQWHIELGPAQTDGITRLLNAMFERVVRVDSVAAGGALGPEVRAILEPSIEEYAFVTPRDAGSPFFAVSIKYRVNVYTREGKLAESWGFTGYGTSPAQGLSSIEPLKQATALAMRDAGAKLAVEFREQPVIRGLLPEAPTADDGAPETPGGDSSSEQESSGAQTAPGEPPEAATQAPQSPGQSAPPEEQTDSAPVRTDTIPEQSGAAAPAEEQEEAPEPESATSGAPAEEAPQSNEESASQGQEDQTQPEPQPES